MPVGKNCEMPILNIIENSYKRRYKVNKEKILEKNRKYQLAHKSEIREYMKMYYQKNKSQWKQ